MPRSRGGQHIWENVAAACRPCNLRKRDRTPDEAGMRLARPCRAPRATAWVVVQRERRARGVAAVPADRVLSARRGMLTDRASYACGRRRRRRHSTSAASVPDPAPRDLVARRHRAGARARFERSAATAIDLDVACAAPGVEVVRRRSGGGAVLLVPGEVVWFDVVVPVAHAARASATT